MKIVRIQIISLVVLSCMTPGSFCGEEATIDDSLRSRVELFLSAWLIDRNVDHAIRFFHPTAFSNPFVFSESCVGGVGTDSKNEAEKRIRRFLKNFRPKQKVKAVRGLLVLNDDMLEPGVKPMNSPVEDGYYLFSAEKSGTNEDWAEQEDFKYLKEHVDLSRSVVCVVGIRFDRDAVGYIYAIWHKDDDLWTIVHANLFCM